MSHIEGPADPPDSLREPKPKDFLATRANNPWVCFVHPIRGPVRGYATLGTRLPGKFAAVAYHHHPALWPSVRLAQPLGLLVAGDMGKLLFAKGDLPRPGYEELNASEHNLRGVFVSGEKNAAGLGGRTGQPVLLASRKRRRLTNWEPLRLLSQHARLA